MGKGAFIAMCGLLLASSLGCGPALRDYQVFTRGRVREVQFNDECKLQSYFDSDPAPPREEMSSSVSLNSRTYGAATYLLEQGRSRRVFLELLSANFKDLPQLGASPLRVRVEFVGGTELRHMPIGARTQIEWSAGTTVLPYHPCLSSFFFGAPYYQARRRLTHS